MVKSQCLQMYRIVLMEVGNMIIENNLKISFYESRVRKCAVWGKWSEIQHAFFFG